MTRPGRRNGTPALLTPNDKTTMSAHDDYLDPDRHETPLPTDEQLAGWDRAKRNLLAILSDNGDSTIQDLGRTVYRYTACGPHLSVLLLDNEWRHCHQLDGLQIEDVIALQIGSIVEGSEATVSGDVIDLTTFRRSRDAVRAFNRSLKDVNKEACFLWDEANAEAEAYEH